MRHKTEKGFFFLVIAASFFIFSFTPQTTGASIGTDAFEISYFSIVGLAFFLIAALIFANRQTLDAIVIPSGGEVEEDRERTDTAYEAAADLKRKGYYVISGEQGDVKHLRDSQRYRIYNQLRKKGVVPGHMIVEGKSHDTEENLLYSLKRLSEKLKNRGKNYPVEVGFVSYPGHLNRFEDFYKKSIMNGLIDENDFVFHKIETDETNEEKAYEQSKVRKALHEYKLARIGRYKAKSGGIKYARPDPIVGILRKTFGFLTKLIPGR